MFIPITVLIVLTTIFLSLEIILRIRHHTVRRSSGMTPGLMKYDPILGWKLNADWRGRHRHHDYDVTYTTNGYGFRGRFRAGPGPPGRMVAVVGDSFTFGFGAEDGETFTELLNADPANPDVYLNFGVPGYSTDQEYLLIRERVVYFSPDTILLAVYLGNDLLDNELPYPLQAARAKPRFTLDSGNLVLQNVPVPHETKPETLRRLDLSGAVFGASRANKTVFNRYLNRLQLFHYLQSVLGISPDLTETFDKRFQDTLKLFFALIEKIEALCRKREFELDLVLVPGRSFVLHPGSPSARMQDYLRRNIIGGCRTRQIGVIDLAGLLRECYGKSSSPWFFPNEGHLTAEGHRVVAAILAENMKPQ